MRGALVYLHALDDPPEEAAGWCMAGARAVAAAPQDAARLLDEARRSAGLVVVSPGFAAQLPAADLDAALTALQPPTVILPADPLLAADPAERVRRQLGLDPELA